MSWAELREQFDAIDPEVWKRVDVATAGIIDRGLLEADPTTLRATSRGLDFADWIADRLWTAVQGP